MNYKTSDIAVIIPAYNCSKTIVNTLDKIFEQRQLPGEVIVINDGSSDSTEETLKNYRYFDKIKYIYQDNAGPAVARNTGIYATEKSWIAFIDADDEWIDSGKLGDQIKIVNDFPNVNLVDTFAKVNWQGEREIEVKREKFGEVFSDFLFSNIVNATSSVLARTKSIRNVGGFDKNLRLGEDRLLWAQLALDGEVRTVPNITVSKINEAGNLTSKGMENYHYRLDLVTKLLALTSVDELCNKSVWLSNLSEFLNLAYRTNNIDGFILVFNDAWKLCGFSLMKTRYFPLAIYAKIFRTFKPLI